MSEPAEESLAMYIPDWAALPLLVVGVLCTNYISRHFHRKGAIWAINALLDDLEQSARESEDRIALQRAISGLGEYVPDWMTDEQRSRWLSALRPEIERRLPEHIG